jgi:hypothetical protein
MADRDPPGQPTTGTAVDDPDAVARLAALAQETRLAIFRLLVQQGPEGLAVGEIAERFIYYSANYRTMNGLIDYLTRNCCQGANCDITCAPAAQRKRRNP